MERRYITSVCERCSSTFTCRKRNPPTRFCSKRCVGLGHVAANCQRCGATLSVPIAGTTKRYCSHACSNRRRGDNFEARFYARIDRSAGPDACWPWTGPRDKDGYGKVIHYSVGDTRAHRVAYEFHLGLPLRSLPADVIVRHSCDNPPCCNPAHLLPGDHQANTDDKIGRDRHTKGEDVNTAVLTEEQVMEARHLYRKEGVSARELCARFNLSRSAMSYALNGKSWKHLPLLLLVLLMAVPAFGQSAMGRLVVTDGSTQSEYGAPASDRNVICPVCEEAGKKSTVRRWLGYSNTLSFSPSFNERTEARFWDEDGRYHDHELAQELLVCSVGHRFYDFDDRRCWCEWPNKRYVVLDEVSGDTITLPDGKWEKLLDHSNGITLNGAVIMPMSYQHPFIQPDLTTPTRKESLQVQKFDRSYFLPFGLAVASSVTDWHSTYGGLNRGGREANPIFRSDQGRAVRWAANVAATAGFLGYTAWLEQTGHRKIARVLLYTLTALRVVASIHNYRIRR